MNQVSCILAAPDLLCEPALVQAAPASGIRVLRRSLDAADLLAAAAVDTSVPVVLSAGLPRLTPDCIARLQLQGRRVIGIAAESTDTDRIRQWGITSVIEISGVQATVSALALALSASVQEPRAATQPGVWATREPVTPAPMVPVPLRVTGTPPGEMQQKRGQVIAVWGPSGSPGRTTTALVMAGALAACGQRVLVVDGDTTAPSVTFLMGIVEDASGLVVATRYASQGRLTS
ncbi:MAG: AAA family ATPase, partial [Candidatus Nanopelagicales bacterium]